MDSPIPRSTAETQYVLGVFEQGAGNHAVAQDHFRLAMELDATLKPESIFHNWCMQLVERKQFEEAKELLVLGVAQCPEDPLLHFFLANSWFDLKNDDEAIRHYHIALQLDQQLPNANANLGTAYLNRGQYNEAGYHFLRSLAIDGERLSTFVTLGWIFRRLERNDEARQCYQAAILLAPNDTNLRSGFAKFLAEIGCQDEAIEHFEAICDIHRDDQDAWGALGALYVQSKRYADAVQCYKEISRLNLTQLKLQHASGEAWEGSCLPLASFISYRKALPKDPSHVPLVNLALVLRQTRQMDLAIACLEQGIVKEPDNLTACLHLAYLYIEVGRYEDAFQEFDNILQVQPECEARLVRGMLSLLLGRFTQGWPDFEFRHLLQNVASAVDFLPNWRKECDIRGRSIYLYADMGLGDSLQFIRYIEPLVALGAHIHLGVQAPLIPLMKGYPGVTRVLQFGDDLSNLDFQCPLASLPLVFDTTLESIPRNFPYIMSSRKKSAQWNERIELRNRPKIGIVWRGNPSHSNDFARSLKLKNLAPLFDIPNSTFISLQKEIPDEDRLYLDSLANVIDVGSSFEDFSDTAGAVSNLDLIIAVDTSVAHLAGAMGKPVWIFLSYLPDFRWMLNRHDSPWYPSATLFRQRQRGDWSVPISEMTSRLSAFLGN
jgi:tetratricopeptide (TPR) repeat protein